MANEEEYETLVEIDLKPCTSFEYDEVGIDENKESFQLTLKGGVLQHVIDITHPSIYWYADAYYGYIVRGILLLLNLAIMKDYEMFGDGKLLDIHREFVLIDIDAANKLKPIFENFTEGTIDDLIKFCKDKING